MPAFSIGADTTSSLGTVINTGAANTKGSYSQLTASLASTIDGFFTGMVTANSSDYLIDVATGAAASETVVVANIPLAGQNESPLVPALFPLTIASGTRIASRGQAVGATLSYSILLIGWSTVTGWLAAATAIDTYGANTADSGGVSVDPGGSANTKGAYSEITSSTSNALQTIGLSIGNVTNSARALANWLVDISTGAAGSETVQVNNIPLRSTTAGDIISPQAWGPFPVAVATSTRIAVRAQCGITDATDRLFDAVITGSRGASAGGSAGGGSVFGAIGGVIH